MQLLQYKALNRVFSESFKVSKHLTCLVSFYSANLADSHDVKIFKTFFGHMKIENLFLNLHLKSVLHHAHWHIFYLFRAHQIECKKVYHYRASSHINVYSLLNDHVSCLVYLLNLIMLELFDETGLSLSDELLR